MTEMDFWRNKKWFVFKLDRRWCTVHHRTMDEAKVWAEAQISLWLNGERPPGAMVPYWPTFEEAMAHVQNRLSA